MYVIMDFKNFIKEVVDLIPEYLLNYDIEKVHIKEVQKNNGILCTGMAICLKGESITPNIYLEYFYNLYKGGQTMEEVLTLIRDEYNQAYDSLATKQYIEFTKDNLKDNIFMKLVNFDKNKELLEECPHVRFSNLAITFRFLVRRDEEGIASAMIKNKEMEDWGLDIEKLYHYGKDNTVKIFKPTIRPLEEVINEFFQGENIKDEVGLQVLTNELGVNGAIYMTYENIIKEYADSIESDLYILPSSIHEVLLLPYKEDVSKDELSSMVKDINEYVVDDMDYLSDEVYIYSREKGFVF